MKSLVNWMRSMWGRAARVLLGVVLIYVGLAMVGGTAGVILAIVGLLPIAMGVWGPCLIEFVLPKPKGA